MAESLKINDPKELDSIHSVIHDCYFDLDDITFDPSSSVLSFRFRRILTGGKYGWRDFFSTSKMRPATEGFLKIYHVESYSINDASKVGTYDFDVLEYDPSVRKITVLTNVPIDIRISVRDFGISAEVTDNIINSSLIITV